MVGHCSIKLAHYRTGLAIPMTSRVSRRGADPGVRQAEASDQRNRETLNRVGLAVVERSHGNQAQGSVGNHHQGIDLQLAQAVGKGASSQPSSWRRRARIGSPLRGVSANSTATFAQDRTRDRPRASLDPAVGLQQQFQAVGKYEWVKHGGSRRQAAG